MSWFPDQVQRKPRVGFVDAFGLLPLAPGGEIVEALDGVPGADHESRAGGGRLLPDLLVHAGLHLARAIAEDDEAKRPGAGRSREEGQHEQQRDDHDS